VRYQSFNFEQNKALIIAMSHINKDKKPANYSLVFYRTFCVN